MTFLTMIKRQVFPFDKAVDGTHWFHLLDGSILMYGFKIISPPGTSYRLTQTGDYGNLLVCDRMPSEIADTFYGEWPPAMKRELEIICEKDMPAFDVTVITLLKVGRHL